MNRYIPNQKRKKDSFLFITICCKYVRSLDGTLLRTREQDNDNKKKLVIRGTCLRSIKPCKEFWIICCWHKITRSGNIFQVTCQLHCRCMHRCNYFCCWHLDQGTFPEFCANPSVPRSAKMQLGECLESVSPEKYAFSTLQWISATFSNGFLSNFQVRPQLTQQIWNKRKFILLPNQLEKGS